MPGVLTSSKRFTAPQYTAPEDGDHYLAKVPPRRVKRREKRWIPQNCRAAPARILRAPGESGPARLHGRCAIHVHFRRLTRRGGTWNNTDPGFTGRCTQLPLTIIRLPLLHLGLDLIDCRGVGVIKLLSSVGIPGIGGWGQPLFCQIAAVNPIAVGGRRSGLTVARLKDNIVFRLATSPTAPGPSRPSARPSPDPHPQSHA